MRTVLRSAAVLLGAIVLFARPSAAQDDQMIIVVDSRTLQEHEILRGTDHVSLEALLTGLRFDWSLSGNEVVLSQGRGRGPRIASDDLVIKLGDRSLPVSGVRRRDGTYVPLEQVVPHLGYRMSVDGHDNMVTLWRGVAPAGAGEQQMTLRFAREGQLARAAETEQPARIRTARGARQAEATPQVQVQAQVRVAPALARFAPAAWAARHGMTGAQFQAEFDKYAAAGYRLVHISGYSVGGQPRFAGVWEQRSGPAWRARFGMTSAEYQNEFSKYAAEGYRLLQVSGYAVGNQPRYAAIWERGSGPPRVARHGLTAAQYQAEFNKWTGEGYRPVVVEGYGVGNTAYFAAIWERSGGPAWAARHGLTAAQFQSEFDKLAAEGYRLTYMSPYDVGNQLRFAAIWEKRDGSVWAARFGLTSRRYQAEFVDRALQGYRLKTVAGYAVGGNARYAAIWVAEPGAATGSYCKNGQCFDLARFADNIEEALKDKDVVKYGLEVRRGLSVIKRASGPKRTAADPPAGTFTVTDRFNPASVAKTVTAVATLQLLGKHGISVDAPIHPHLPPTWNVPASAKTITFRDLLNHTSGLQSGDGHEYSHVRAVVESGSDLQEKAECLEGKNCYKNINYSLLRILVASLDGMEQWALQPGTLSAARFTGYVNREIFTPLGIYDVEYKPVASAPTLFYPHPPGTAKGTAYGDWSNRPGSAGSHASVHELAVFAAATFAGWLLPDARLAEMKHHGLGFGDYGATPDGGRCWGKGGYFPASMNSGAELNSVLVHCDGGTTAMLVVNGAASAKHIVLNAFKNAFVPEVAGGEPGPSGVLAATEAALP